MAQETIELSVKRVDDMNKQYVAECNGRQVRVRMMPEQVGRGNPGTIVCTAVQDPSGKLLVRQDLETLLRRHYKEGDEVDYTVKKVGSGSNFELVDGYGYRARLVGCRRINPEMMPRIRCRITGFGDRGPDVELIDGISLESSQLTVSAGRVESLLQPHTACAGDIARLLLAGDVAGSFDSECHLWIHDVCRGRGLDGQGLEKVRRACLWLLEESPLLGECNGSGREVIEQRLTTLIEQAGYYARALRTVGDGSYVDKLDAMIGKLQGTGYVYHPKEMFYVMMCVLLVKSQAADGQQFIDGMMPRLFDTLRSGSFDNWCRRPFRELWTELLEFLIQTLNASPDKLASDPSALGNMVQALALQYNLADDDAGGSDAGTTLNLAMLYRYCSQVGVVDPMRLLDVAFLTVIQAVQDKPHGIDLAVDPMRTANIIYNQACNFVADSTPRQRYEGEGADIVVDAGSVAIVPKDAVPGDTLARMIPDYLGLWHGLQVEQYGRPQPIGKERRALLKPFKELWADAQRGLVAPQRVIDKRPKVSTPAEGDEVGVVVTDMSTAADSPVFRCKVVDPAGVQGTGTLLMSDMVGYATAAVDLMSFEKGGRPLVFTAVVSAVNGDGTCVFSAKDYIEQFCEDWRCDHIGYGDRVRCVVTGGDTTQPFYAVSEYGQSVVVRYAEGSTPLPISKYTVIEVTGMTSGSRKGFAEAVFGDIAGESAQTFDGGARLTLANIFKWLMRHYADDETYEPQEAGEEEADTLIERPCVLELMRIIASVADLESDYIKAYNYFGFCRLMATVAGAGEQHRFYDGKMALIELLYEFDANESISGELIAKFEATNAALCARHSTLQHQFRKLQVVSYLGKDQHDRELCDTACSSASPDLAQLARLVASYNFMHSAGMAAQAENVKERIKELLNLQKKENPKKQYGQENYTIEHKTSVIYPPDNHMRPDPQRQTHKVMEEICAMLNAAGGTLYIGVDDKTCLECGVGDDLAYSWFGGSRDKYDLYVHDNIRRLLSPGALADHCVSTSWDEEAHVPVYVVRMEPCPRPVSVDGVYYERCGTSSRRVSAEYEKDFLDNRVREIEMSRRSQELAAPAVPQAVTTADAVSQQSPQASDVQPEPAAAPPQPYAYSTRTSAIRTSLTRAFRHKDDGLQDDELTFYLNIYDDNTFSVTDQQQYGDCLSLGFYDDELEADGTAVVVVYATGEMSRIPLKELLGRDRWKQSGINNKSQIVFVSPAVPGDVLAVLYHSKNNDYYRLLTVDNIDHGSFNTSMRPFYSGQVGEILDCEIVRLDSPQKYRNILDTGTDKPGGDAGKPDGKRAAQLIKEQRGG